MRNQCFILYRYSDKIVAKLCFECEIQCFLLQNLYKYY